MTARAACAGQPELMEATDVGTHAIARELCNGCGFIERCRELRDVPGKAGGSTYLSGTWAGELWIEGRRADTGTPVPRAPLPCRTCKGPMPPRANIRYCSDACRKEGRRRTQANYEARKPKATTCVHGHALSENGRCMTCSLAGGIKRWSGAA